MGRHVAKLALMCFSAFQIVKSQSELGDAVADIVFPTLTKMFKPKCSISSNPNALRELLLSADDVGTCASSKSPLKRGETDIIEHICKSYRHVEHNCLRNFTKKLEDCLQPQEAFLADFVLVARKSNFDYVCKNNGNTLRSLNSAEVGQCQIKQVNVLWDCVKQSKLVENFGTNGTVVVTKKGVCSDLTELVGCLYAETKEQCGSNTKVAEYLAAAYKTYLSPCNTVTV